MVLLKKSLKLSAVFVGFGASCGAFGYAVGKFGVSCNNKAFPFSTAMAATPLPPANIVSLVGRGFNRGMWNKLEKYVRKLARKYPNVYICSGPLFLPRPEPDGKLYVRYQVIGSNHVAVPTHFFKVILADIGNRNFELECFVLPNQPIEDNTDLKRFLVPLETVERAAGFLIFDKLSRKSLKKINGK